jgi:hypothetical protein
LLSSSGVWHADSACAAANLVYLKQHTMVTISMQIFLLGLFLALGSFLPVIKMIPELGYPYSYSAPKTDIHYFPIRHEYNIFNYWMILVEVYKKGKAIPVTDRGGPQGCETSRFSHFLDNRLTDGGKVVSLQRRPPFTPRKIPGTHFC